MQNITTQTETTLIQKESGESGELGLKIVNNHTASSTISLWISEDTTKYYHIKSLVMPTATAFIINDISLDPETQSLILKTESATTDITVFKIR